MYIYAAHDNIRSVESTVAGIYISLSRCNSVTSVNGMDGSVSAECQWLVDLVTSRRQNGTKCESVQNDLKNQHNALSLAYFARVQIRCYLWKLM
jgi:aspartate carbamoyltransferase catalytic subunit